MVRCCSELTVQVRHVMILFIWGTGSASLNEAEGFCTRDQLNSMDPPFPEMFRRDILQDPLEAINLLPLFSVFIVAP